MDMDKAIMGTGKKKKGGEPKYQKKSSAGQRYRGKKGLQGRKFDEGERGKSKGENLGKRQRGSRKGILGTKADLEVEPQRGSMKYKRRKKNGAGGKKKKVGENSRVRESTNQSASSKTPVASGGQPQE